jgi:hypothetical protein
MDGVFEIGPVIESNLPANAGVVADMTPVAQAPGGDWLMLGKDGVISRWDLAEGTCIAVGRTSVPGEPDHAAWAGHRLRRRLHVSGTGRFVAVVNDYGRFGQVIDLEAGRVCLALDGDSYHANTVPFSLVFARHRGVDVVVHRTDWNRLDVSEAATGRLLTDRGTTSYRSGDPRPEHYLDYFHGALYLSPDGSTVFDDGWVWQPFGIPVAWNLAAWLDGNLWESEDGPTKIDFCVLEYWDRAAAWIGDHLIAIEDIGDDETPACTRVFDITRATPQGPGRIQQAAEIAVLHGPQNRFFSDGAALLSAGDDGLTAWDPFTGTLIGSIPGFTPAYYHPGARELVGLNGATLRRCRLAVNPPRSTG